MFLLGIWDVIQTAAYDFGMSFVLVRRLSFVMFQPIAIHLTTCPQAPLDSTNPTTLRHSKASLHRSRNPFSRPSIVHDVLVVSLLWRESMPTSMSTLRNFKLNELSALSMCDRAIAESTMFLLGICDMICWRLFARPVSLLEALLHEVTAAFLC